MTDKMREEFEAWAKPIGLDVDYIYADDAFKCYCFTATQNAFDTWKSGWQASRAALCVELSQQGVLHHTTTYNAPDVELNRVGTHHNALDDAASQADHLIRMIQV